MQQLQYTVSQSEYAAAIQSHTYRSCTLMTLCSLQFNGSLNTAAAAAAALLSRDPTGPCVTNDVHVSRVNLSTQSATRMYLPTSSTDAVDMSPHVRRRARATDTGRTG